MKPILDACCGSRMFWFDKNNKNVVFMDNRKLETELCDGRKLIVNPDIIGNFRNLPFRDKQFKLVVFDPPHLVKVGQNSWLYKKYGRLEETWEDDLKRGFSECFRVLEDCGILVFKWNEQQIKMSDIKPLLPCEPLFGDKRAKTFWLVFMK